uniref:DUF6824 domain-containing protein n=1 Tax=Pseudo-nitzschia australis TaxID=44445 RepID=A0A7S4AL70_9STRA
MGDGNVDGPGASASINTETTTAPTIDVCVRSPSLLSSTSSTEGYQVNGGPKAAAALLSLGQDLTKGTGAIAAAAALVPASCRMGTDQQQQQQQQQHHQQVSQPSQAVKALELVATRAIPMLSIDNIGTTKLSETATTIAGINSNVINKNTYSDANASNAKNKRRRSNCSPNVVNQNNQQQQGGVSAGPPDFWHWLSPGEHVGNWDVICGRGGESNHFIGNKRYRKVVNERKADYRKIDVAQRKRKTNFVRAIVQHIKNQGGKFIDIASGGKYYVVTDEKARKKTSQALRETKELKWLVGDDDNDNDGNTNNNNNDIQKRHGFKKTAGSNKIVVCRFCGKTGHKTRIAKACLKHHEWLDVNANVDVNLNVNVNINLNVNSSSAEKTDSTKLVDGTGTSSNNNPVLLPLCRPSTTSTSNPAVSGTATATSSTGVSSSFIPSSGTCSLPLGLEPSSHDREIDIAVALWNPGANEIEIARTTDSNSNSNSNRNSNIAEMQQVLPV